ncbi:MAG: LpqB family beta-propeller domain-containing protein, partial [Actinomycetales bacterium]
VIQQENGSSVLLARIIKGRSDASLSITGPRRVEGTLTQVVDASWSGAGDLAVLGSPGGESISVWSVDLTRGTASDRGGPAAAVTVAAAPGHPLLVGAGDGYVYGYRAAGWASVGNGTAPAYPG